MSKKLILVLASLLVLSALAAATDNVVSGTVYTLSNSKVVSGADVTVVCNNNIRKTVSAYDGSYSAFYSGGQCDEGSKVKVSAKKGRLIGNTVETMSDFGLQVDLAIADVFFHRIVNNPKLQMTGFVDDYSKDVFVNINNYGRKTDAKITATLLSTGETQREKLTLGSGAKKLRIFQFGTIDLIPGENVIELFAQAGSSRVTKYISYYNK